METNVTEITASGAPKAAGIANRIPDWLDETPEPREPDTVWDPYTLMVQQPEGEQVQIVEMTRAEYIALKNHLAKLRGFEVSETGGETAPAEAAAPTNGAAVKSASGRMTACAIVDIVDRLRGRAELYSTPSDNEKLAQVARNEFQGDMLLLQQIISDGIDGCFADEFPHETPLIAAIRGNLHL